MRGGRPIVRDRGEDSLSFSLSVYADIEEWKKLLELCRAKSGGKGRGVQRNMRGLEKK